jgi:galactokinase
MKEELLNSNENWLRDKLKTDEEIHSVAVPASLILLGDHTHYNDGIIISCAVNRFAVASVIKRNDDKINLDFCDCDLTYSSSLISAPKDKIICGQVSFNALLDLLKEEEILQSGFDCSICSNIPAAIGIGSISAHQVALLSALNKSHKLNLTDEEIIDLSRRAELNTIGAISNRANHRTVLSAKQNNFLSNDLRSDSTKQIALNKKNSICNL